MKNKKIKYLIGSLVLLIGLHSSLATSKQHYTIDKVKNSSNIGKTYKIESPHVYIENISLCNQLEKYVAINSSCRLLSESVFKIGKTYSNCTGCLDKERMPYPLRVRLKESSTLTVIKEYSTRINYLSYKIFGGDGRIIYLLKDENGNKIEASPIQIKVLEMKNSRKNKKTMDRSVPISKNLCFYNENQFQKIEQMIIDFEFQNSIETEEIDCYHLGLKKGINIKTNNFDEFFTFDYYKHEWGIYGKWLN